MIFNLYANRYSWVSRFDLALILFILFSPFLTSTMMDMPFDMAKIRQFYYFENSFIHFSYIYCQIFDIFLLPLESKWINKKKEKMNRHIPNLVAVLRDSIFSNKISSPSVNLHISPREINKHVLSSSSYFLILFHFLLSHFRLFILSQFIFLSQSLGEAWLVEFN